MFVSFSGLDASSILAAARVGPANVLYVDGQSGNNATAQRGNYARPYLTIQAALDATQTDDVVQLAPQEFDLSASLTIPAATTRITIQGWGLGNTISITAPQGTTTLAGASGVNVFDLGAHTGLARCTIRNMAISFQGTGEGIHAFGDLYTGTFLSGGLLLQNVEFIQGGSGGALNLKYVRNTHLMNCWGTTNGGAMTLTSCGNVEYDSSVFPSSALTVTYDNTDALRSTTQTLVRMRSSVIGGVGSDRGITIGGQARLDGDYGSRVGFITGSGLSVSGAVVPSILFYGQIGTNGTISAINLGVGNEIPDTATALTLDFRGARIFGAASFRVAGAAANAQTVRWDGAQLMTAAQSVPVRQGINLVFTNGGSNGATFTTPDGTGSVLPPSPYKMTAVAVAAPTAFAFGFRVPAATYAVTATSDTVASAVTAVNGRTVNGFNVQVAAAGGGTIEAVVNFG